MTGTKNETTTLASTVRGESPGRAGVLTFATPAPAYPGPMPHFASGSTVHKTDHPTRRNAIIGGTAVALLVAAMGGVAYYRAQETATAPVTAVPGTSVVAALPHGAVAAIDTTAVPIVAAGTLATALPHGAVAAVDETVAPVVVMVPHGAAATS
jgi:hypothetical protein